MSTRTSDEPPPAGRVNQRRRTQQAIITAASELLERGHTPTVAEVADAAAVSRATAYRYFPSQDDLVAACLVQESAPLPEELFARPDAPTDAEDRVVFVAMTLWDFIRPREPQFRQFLRRQLALSMQPDGDERTLRPGWRVSMLDLALEPVADALGPERVTRLRNALAMTVPTEALIVARDILHLDDDTAKATIEWNCRMLVRAALAEAAAG